MRLICHYPKLGVIGVLNEPFRPTNLIQRYKHGKKKCKSNTNGLSIIIYTLFTQLESAVEYINEQTIKQQVTLKNSHLGGKIISKILELMVFTLPRHCTCSPLPPNRIHLRVKWEIMFDYLRYKNVLIWK